MCWYDFGLSSSTDFLSNYAQTFLFVIIRSSSSFKGTRKYLNTLKWGLSDILAFTDQAKTVMLLVLFDC